MGILRSTTCSVRAHLVADAVFLPLKWQQARMRHEPPPPKGPKLDFALAQDAARHEVAVSLRLLHLLPAVPQLHRQGRERVRFSKPIHRADEGPLPSEHVLMVSIQLP